MTVHIASPDVARRIRRLNGPGDAVVAFADNLLVGPFAEKHTLLAEARSRYWSCVQSRPSNVRSMYSRLIRSMATETDVVVWSSGTLQHTMLLWMVCALLAKRPETRLRAVVAAQTSQRANDQFGCVSCEFRADEIRNLIKMGEKLGPGARRAAARNWRAFAGRAPTAFNDRCRARPAELSRVGIYHTGHFPRLWATRLRVSVLDELLLRCVGAAWSLPSEVLLRRSSEGMLLRSWIACAGDVFIARRLQDWARHSSVSPVLESETTGGDHLLTGVRYRLSPHGRVLLEQGIRSVSEAPMCLIGGGAAYDHRSPVAALEDGDWKLVRL